MVKVGAGEAELGVALKAIGAKDWLIRRVPLEPTGRAWDVVFLSTIDPAAAWDLTHRLLKEPFVEDAEPSFEVQYAEGHDVELEATSAPLAAGELDENQSDWSLKFVRAETAWSLPGSASAKGKGILVGHPDSGYRAHTELGANFKHEHGWDFIENDAITDNPGGGHGLGTASVICSPDNRGAKASITGIAPEAEVIPLRVTKPRGFIPAPILFNLGAERLRDAVWFAIHRRVHVISISLGWLPHSGLQRAIQEAVRQNIIVIAAAGNYTWRLVVWPAAYPEVIAMAACNARGKPWAGSARGPAVDATGPGKKVWTAQHENEVGQSSGTSHATATVAGIAALWLAHHGRQKLLDTYPGKPLSEVFREVLTASCRTWDENPEHWGAGLVDAAACLERPLPKALESVTPIASQATPLTEAFSAVARPELQRRVADVFGVEEAAVPQLDAEHGRELRFWALTRPAIRKTLLGDPAPVLETTTNGHVPVSSALRSALNSHAKKN